MNKKFLLFSLLVLFLALFMWRNQQFEGLNNVDVLKTTTDVNKAVPARVSKTNTQDLTEYKELFKYSQEEISVFKNIFESSRIGQDKFNRKIKAVSLPGDSLFFAEIDDFFYRLQKSQEIKTFVILLNNIELKGKTDIVMSEYGFITPFGKIATIPVADKNLLESIDLSNRAFVGNDDLKNILPFIINYYPEAKIQAFWLKPGIDNKNIESLSKYLKNTYLEKTVILVKSPVISANNKNLASFQSEYDIFDRLNLNEIDFSENPDIKVLKKYFSDFDSSSPSLLSKVEKYTDAYKNSFFVNYYEGKSEDPKVVSILSFGDMMLGRYVRTLTDVNGLDYIFEKLLAGEPNIFSNTDFIFANLEGPIKGTGYKSGTSLIFGFHENVAPFLKKYNFNLLSIANNHALNQGISGRTRTIEVLQEQNIGWCGNPKDVDRNSVFYSEKNGVTLAFVCFNQIEAYLDLEAANTLVKELDSKVDLVIVSIHWGYEYKHTPDKNKQINPAHAFVDSGADLIIGHHPHVVQSFEVYNDKFIIYSLGNFVFDQYWSSETQEELSIGFLICKNPEVCGFKTKAYLFPLKSEKSQPRFLNLNEFTIWIEEFISYVSYSEEMKQQIRKGLIEIY